MSNSPVEIRQTAGKGRGVFAAKRYARGEIIETCPVIVFAKKDVPHIDGTILQSYYFRWDRSEGTVALVLGYGSLYNHSYEPNAVYERDHGSQEMRFKALRTIPVGEEILVNYNGDPKCRDVLWFHVL